MARSLSLMVVMTCLSLTCFLSESAELPRVLVEHSVKDDKSLSFLVVGDWGRGGAFNQSQVAHQVVIIITKYFLYNMIIKYLYKKEKSCCRHGWFGCLVGVIFNVEFNIKIGFLCSSI